VENGLSGVDHLFDTDVNPNNWRMVPRQFNQLTLTLEIACTAWSQVEGAIALASLQRLQSCSRLVSKCAALKAADIGLLSMTPVASVTFQQDGRTYSRYVADARLSMGIHFIDTDSPEYVMSEVEGPDTTDVDPW
jgi:hypothetical protein